MDGNRRNAFRFLPYATARKVRSGGPMGPGFLAGTTREPGIELATTFIDTDWITALKAGTQVSATPAFSKGGNAPTCWAACHTFFPPR